MKCHIELKNIHKNFDLSNKSIRTIFEKKEKKHALNGVDFKAYEGEIIGFIGANGSGKTTLLKIISGLLIPDRGHVDIKGRISPMLDIGIGFHPELTGIENIRLFSSISTNSPLNKNELEEIKEFSGLTPKSLNLKYKFYSSGMKVRLGFSTVAFLKPDIVLLDEITSVGDVNFQEKTRKKIMELKKNSKIMILVSHDVNYIKDLTTRTLALVNGKVLCDTTPEKAGYEYLKYMEKHGDDKI
ncbi:MAG: ABC transporter ATP-binding protein [Candidatus Muiribacteriota bacterium]